MRRFWLAFTCGVVTALALALIQDARGYETLGFKMDHTAITHSGPLDSYIAEALREWGQYSAITDGGAGDDILIQMDGPMIEGSCGETFPKWRNGFGEHDGIAQRADISISSACWASEDEVTRQRLVSHEVGHALGMAHSTVLGSLMEPRQSTGEPHGPFSCDDAAGIAALYPPRVHLDIDCEPALTYPPHPKDPVLPPTEAPGPTATPTPGLGRVFRVYVSVSRN